MNQHDFKQKVGSIMVIMALITSSLFVILPKNSIFSLAIDAPSSTEKIDNDFYNGTLNNVEITAKGNDTVLRLIDIDLNEWTEKTPENSPLERGAHALAPIFGTDKILLFGGLRGSNPILDDTWIYDLSENKWTNKTPNIHPGARYEHAVASIWGTDKVVLMGGKTTSNVLNDTWLYDFSNNTWTDVTIKNNPGKISQHKIASIYGEKKLVLFGGDTPGKNETWVYDLTDNEWAFKTPANSPPGRVAHSMASIWGTDKALIFGGIGDRNDSWVYDLSENNWTQIAYGPPGRFQHDIATIYGRDNVILFGGFNWSVGDSNDTWIFDFSENTWTQIFPKNDPGKRLSHLMSSVWGTDKIVLFSGARGPLINDTWILNPFEYVNKGTFISSPYDIGPNSSFKTISWETNLTINASIRFQVRTSETEVGLNSEDFIGPDGFKTSYYIFTPTDIWSGHDSDRWIQYKAYLSTTNYEETPRLKNVTITYNYWPNTTLIKPDNESIINNNCPVFTWNFTDRDSTNQSGFHAIIDDDINFESVNYDSNEQSSPNRSWQFPNGTGYTEITDGIWYWKVRTKDNDGDWGHFSQPWKIIIDNNGPHSIITKPQNNKFYNNLVIISGKAFESIDGTGLNRIEITIKRLDDNSYWTGSNWASLETWLITTGTTKWTYDTNSVIWLSGFKYNIHSRAIDNATNIEIPKNGKIITMDFFNVTFSNAFPLFIDVSSMEDVEVGITISDQISGVNASTIEYSISEDNGESWTTWEPVFGLENGRSVNITLNLTFINGTENRIKWRAKDLVGNGPKESKTYLVKVNTWQPTPIVSLWRPGNGSISQSTSVELTWMLETWKLTNVSYDVYFDTNNPPAMKQSGVINTSIIINDLTNSETYYWTIIPKLGNTNGSCISGIWSFTVDIIHIKPSVILISPPNGSVIQALRPTFVWSVNYDGSEELTYDIYLGKNNSLEKEILDCQDTNYLSKDTLVFNETYYWKVVPKAGDIPGFGSEIWWFTVKSKDYIPIFGIELILEPATIEIKSGETRYIYATVTNLGEIADKLVLSIPEVLDPRLIGEINEPKMMDVDPDGKAVFNITIQTNEDAKEDIILITVAAASSNAAGYDQVVEKRATLTVKILGQEEHDTGSSSDASWYWIILLIIFVIIIVLIIVGLILKRKKEPEQESPPVEATAPELEKVEVQQTSENGQEVVSIDPTISSTIEPTEPESKPPIQATPEPAQVPGQVPQPQIPVAPEQPQLPPANIETKEENVEESTEKAVESSPTTPEDNEHSEPISEVTSPSSNQE